LTQAAVGLVAGNGGDVISWAHDRFEAVFEKDSSAAVSTAVGLQEWLIDNKPADVAPIGVCVALAKGPVGVHVWKPEKGNALGEFVRTALEGEAVERAARLAATSVDGAVLMDAGLINDLSLRYLGSRVGRRRGWSGLDYLGSIRELRSERLLRPIVYYELKWSGEELLRDEEISENSEPKRLLGVFSQWNLNDRASVRAGDGEILWTDKKRFLGSAELAPGDRISFMATPADKPGLPRTAEAIAKFGESLTGRVVSVFPERRYGFVRVDDERGGHQDFFLHADDNAWPMRTGDGVRFQVGENARGPIAVNGVISGES
jgi:cold shock CspA family protein